jgi:hypothetical protein
VARFAPLDAPSVVADPLPAMTSAAVPAPPPPKRGSGFAVRGAVVAVSPVVSLRVPREGGAVSPDAETNRLGEGPETIRHRFFLVELGDACASCGGNGGGTGTGTPPTRDPSDRSEPLSWRRRLVFTGDALARWHPFFGAATGGGGAEVTCACVEVTNLRASRLFKGEGDRRELRVAAATAATTVAVGRPTVAAREAPFDRDAGIASGGCACASCARGDTVSFLDAYVLGEDPSGLGVRVSGRRDGRGVPFLLTHARVGSPPRGGVAFPALRPGTLVRVTHAHPVWRRRAEVRGGDDDEAFGDDADSDDSDDASSDDASSDEIKPLKKTPERRVEDETDHFGCRALGACVRTRVFVLRRSPLAASAPRLFAETAASRSRHDE